MEIDNPWQLCRTIGPLLSQRFPLASAKGGIFTYEIMFCKSGGVGFKMLTLLMTCISIGCSNKYSCEIDIFLSCKERGC